MAGNHSGWQIIRYTQCCRNFGIDTGCTIVDGCQEFSPSVINDMLCEACFCLRNFHRPEVSISTVPITSGDRFSLDDLLLESQSLPLSQPTPPPAVEAGGATSKRTKIKFTDEQRAKMYQLAELINWRTSKQELATIEESCSKTGIPLDSFKNWVKNTKSKQRKN